MVCQRIQVRRLEMCIEVDKYYPYDVSVVVSHNNNNIFPIKGVGVMQWLCRFMCSCNVGAKVIGPQSCSPIFLHTLELCRVITQLFLLLYTQHNLIFHFKANYHHFITYVGSARKSIESLT
jgi:hypothetical protein